MSAHTNDAAFQDVARQFCTWCDAAMPSELNPSELSRDVQLLLARLISAALLLTDAWEEAPDVAGPSADQLAQILPRLSALPVTLYGTFLNPSALDDPAVIGNLTDDLQDIYADLKVGLALHASGYSRAAAWHWRFSYQTHWGRHAASALHALQAESARLHD